MRKKSPFRLVEITTLWLLLLTQLLIAQTVTLKFIETSDVHGSIFPYNFIYDRQADGSLAQVYTYVEKERQNKNQDVILLDNGDILQGQPVVYYYNFEKTNVPHIYAEVMNYMGYDVGTVGNHDIETGHAVYDRFQKELHFPWLAANAMRTQTGKPYFLPYTILKKNDVKIAVLGLITPAIPNWLPEKIWQGMTFEDMVETARKWVQIIRDNEKPDVLIGLFHSGVEYSYGNLTADTPKNENASRLVAERVPGFDVVIVGHDHHGWNVATKNSAGKNVLVLGSRAHATDIAVATVKLTFEEESKTWRKKSKGERIEMKNILPDSVFLREFHAAFVEVKEYVSRRIGTFTKTISTKDAFFGDSPFVDLIHNIQLELSTADISFAAPLSFNASIHEGDVYVRDMFKLYKYENLLYTMELSGQEINDYLEYSYSRWFNRMQSANDHLLNFKKDENGNLIHSNRSGSYQLAARSYNFDSAAGIRYTVDVSKPAGERVNILSMANGDPFNLKATYKVAVNSYRGNGGGGHLTAGAGIPREELAARVVSSTDKDLRFFLMKWIERQGRVTPKAFGNWQVIPESWWQAGKERDMQILFKHD